MRRAAGEFAQDAEDFARFFFVEADEFVVEVDGIERFEEESLAGGTGAVDDAGEFAALAGDDGDDEAVVADGDVFFLQHTFVAVGAEEAFERILNASFLLFDVAAEAVEMGAGAIEDGAVGRDLAVDFFEERAEIADIAGAGGQQRETFGYGVKVGARVGCTVEEGDEVEDFARLQRGAFDVEFLDGDGDVGELVEADGERGASGCGSGVGDGFTGFGEDGFEAWVIVGGLDGFEFGMAERTADVAGEKGTDLVPFKRGCAGVLHCF